MLDTKRSQVPDLDCMDLASDCMQLGYDHLGEALETEIRELGGVSSLFPGPSARHQFDLECLRAAADCMQLVGEIRDPALQRHFLNRARQLTAAAETRPRPALPEPQAIT